MDNMGVAFANFMNSFKDKQFGIFNTMSKEQKERFEVLTASLRKEIDSTSFSVAEAKSFACNDIANNLTKIPNELPFISELGSDEPFCFLARVDTSASGDYDPRQLTKQLKSRKFLSYTVITEKNISHYQTKHPFMLAYNMPAEAIVHVFPTDSDTNINASNEDEVSAYPSLWLTLDELNEFTNDIQLYNQITCKTKVNGEYILPAAILVFNETNDAAEEAAKNLGLPVIIAHPQKDAINYIGDSVFIDRDREAASKYNRMVEVFRSRLVRCFKTKNEKRIFDAFMKSFAQDLMNMVMGS